MTVAPDVEMLAPDTIASVEKIDFSPGKLSVLPLAAVLGDAGAAINELRRDQVVLVKGASQSDADSLLLKIATGLGLRERLELQAGMAAHQDHRRRVGQFFMTVNARKDYQFISSHSEGASAANIQLASFFCAQNSTDGGETILLNVDGAAGVWGQLREKVVRIDPASHLTLAGLSRAKVEHRLDGANALPKNDDVIIGPRKSDIPGLRLLDVLAKPVKAWSVILEDERFAYWDSVASTDHSGLDAFAAVLKHRGLLRQKGDEESVSDNDTCADRRIWRSGADHLAVFKSGLQIKLEPGDFVVQNNLTWTHAVAGWTPQSGVRTVVVGFA